MAYVISFLEGIITFISPCLLPMLPIYAAYFAGSKSGENKRGDVINALGFVLGFSLIFIILGAFAGSIGGLLKQHANAVNIITGSVVVIFGMNFTGVFKTRFLNKSRAVNYSPEKTGFFSSALFGVVFSLGWTPCAGAFLGSALMMAASGANTLKGTAMLLCYSLGLGVPFIISAVIIQRMKTAFDFIKRHNRAICVISGCLLVAVGIMMIFGLISKYFWAINI
jgi:cytochrome c-type biogenesis protein